MAKKIDINGLDHFKETENAMIASEYSSSKTYAVGDYVYHNGTLYKCTTAITTAEAWTSGHWTAAKLADDCSGLMTAFTQLDDVVGTSKFDSNDFYYRKIINESGGLQDSTKNVLLYPIDVVAGDIIGLKDYVTYKYCYKTYSNGVWGSASAWYTMNMDFSAPKKICLYIRRNDGDDVNETDLAVIKQTTFLYKPDTISTRLMFVENQENGESSSMQRRTDFVNNFIPSSMMELPSDFSDFPIGINISKYNSIYGHDLNPRNYIKNNANGATYYCSPDGNDSNSGTTPSAPLKTIGAAIGKSDVNTIILLDGSYYYGTHFTSSAINKEINLIGFGNVYLRSGFDESAVSFSKGCYVENIIFDGGSSACNTSLGNELIVFNRCSFINSTGANGLTALGGKYILVDCIATNNRRDGFNYHYGNSNAPQVVEINCKGKFDGINSTETSDNGSTIHDVGSRIIRIGCDYSACRGATVADADGGKSLNIAVKSYSTEAVATANRNANFVSIGASSKMWLYDCISFGSPYDIIADAGTIYTTETYQRENTVNSGTITHINTHY